MSTDQNNNKINTSKFDHLYSFKSHYHTIGGFKYHYVDEGSGSPVVMLHGNPTWSFYFRNLIKGLSSDFRVIVPDHIGCGFSEKPHPRAYAYRLKNRIQDLEQFLNSLELSQKVTLVLHDWGGAIGMAWAVRHPQKVGRLIITNTAAFPIPEGKKLPLSLWILRNFKGLATIAVLGFNLFVRGALLLNSRKPLPKEVKAGLKAPYNSWRNRIATLRFVQDIPIKTHDPSYAIISDLDQNLHKLKRIPTLICWGEHDFVFDHTYLCEWQNRFPAAETHVFPDAGHYLLEDASEKVLATVKDFIQKHPINR